MLESVEHLPWGAPPPPIALRTHDVAVSLRYPRLVVDTVLLIQIETCVTMEVHSSYFLRFLDFGT